MSPPADDVRLGAASERRLRLVLRGAERAGLHLGLLFLAERPDPLEELVMPLLHHGRGGVASPRTGSSRPPTSLPGKLSKLLEVESGWSKLHHNETRPRLIVR